MDKVSKVRMVSDNDFSEEVLESGRPAVVDFWATWCVPCRKLDEILSDIASDYEGRVSFFRVDVNESNETTNRFAVRSIPMLLFFSGGKIVDSAVGSLSRETIEKKLESILEST